MAANTRSQLSELSQPHTTTTIWGSGWIGQ
jgi:hypothetical protein